MQRLRGKGRHVPRGERPARAASLRRLGAVADAATAGLLGVLHRAGRAQEDLRLLRDRLPGVPQPQVHTGEPQLLRRQSQGRLHPVRRARGWAVDCDPHATRRGLPLISAHQRERSSNFDYQVFVSCRRI